ncbi:HdeD family acid-resistance protein [Arthrobacter sp. AQ5-05]|uniref:HdeD family acid-resistance protein n=1 Tax=Arthrobacter sp. AQ5-05 TaxID=2184581 RepID=UPI0012B601A4|nr:DUF308 domain-containing protein [Arthrobacter sp. AQ5-05]
MSSQQPTGIIFDEFALDPAKLAKSAIKGLRFAFGISGAVALILGVLLLFWPTKTLAVVAVFLGLNFLITGAVKLALGIFTHGLSAGMRILDILFGLILAVAGIVAIKNSAATGEFLLIFTVIIIGIGWIIEGILAVVESGTSTSRTWAVLFGGLSIVAGIVVLVVPTWTAAWLLLITGVSLVILGLAGIVRAVTFGRGILAGLSTGT